MARPRLQTEETWPDQLDRLRSMTDPLQETWDLSPNDTAAIAGAVARLTAAAALVNEWRAYAEIAESKNRAEQWTRCADKLAAALGDEVPR